MTTTTHGYDFAWRTPEGGSARVCAEGFDTREQADEAFRRSLDTFGYEPPKWWQYWRWGESVPGPYRQHT